MKWIYLFFVLVFAAVMIYHLREKKLSQKPIIADTSVAINSRIDSVLPLLPDSLPVSNPYSGKIETGNVSPASIVSFAKTLLSTPYLYGSSDPKKGFDCSGFITYVFNHFGIAVPRSSIDFTNTGTSVNISNALPADLILFTGTDSTEKFVGHMGIVTGLQNDSLQFIHSTSGKARGVVLTTLNQYYQKRFVKVIRIF